MAVFNLTKKEVAKVIADKYTEFTQKEITDIIDEFIEVIKSEVANGEKVSIPKFGIFESVERAARECRNPQTNERMQIPAYNTPKFKPASDFKNMVKG